jgi:hypothetical protein
MRSNSENALLALACAIARLPRTIALAVALLVAGGCGSPSQGTAHVTVSTASLAVEAVSVTISSGDGPGFSPIVAQLSASASGWEGYVTGIPAGPGRRFDVAVTGATGLIASGSRKADVVNGGTTTLYLTISAPAPAPFQNSAPSLEWLTASAVEVEPGGAVLLDAVAVDPDGDPLGYGWTATCGTFDAPWSASPTWTAPAAAGSCTLTVSVGDNHGALVAGSIIVDVKAR